MSRRIAGWTTTLAAAALVALPLAVHAQPAQPADDVLRTDFAKLETDYDRVVNHTAVGTTGTAVTTPAPTGTAGSTATPAATNDWRPAYTAVESDLRELLGTQAEQSSATTGTAAPQATTGSTSAAGGGSVIVPANVRSQLDQFRQDLQKFYAAAGQTPPQHDAPATATAPTSGAVGTPGAMTAPGRSERVVAAEPSNADVLLQRIEDIVNNSISSNKPIERAQLDEIRAELEQLKTLVQK